MPVPAPIGVSWLVGAPISLPNVLMSTMPVWAATPGVPPLPPLDPLFDKPIAVTAPITRVATSASDTRRGTHLEGLFGAGWSGRGAQPTGEGWVGWVQPVLWPVPWPVPWAA